ncbi:MAG: hypothetical protein ABIQ18_42710 [Umezawaea sp.]
MGEDDELSITTRHRDGVLVVTVAGRLDWSTYLRLQDQLLDHAGREPLGVVVEVDDLDVRCPVLLVVFDIVWTSAARWSGTPLMMVVDNARVAEPLDARGLPRHMPRFRTTGEALAAMAVLRHGDHVDAPLPSCRCRPHVAEEATDRACRRWGVSSLLEIAPQVAAEMVSHTDEDAEVSLVLRRREGELSIGVRTSTRLATDERLTLRHNIASIAVCDFRMGETRVSPDRMVLWTVLDIPADQPVATAN